MFLAAVARPRFDAFGNEVFSGKIGIFPLTTLEPAKRSSKNRVAGTLETKPILSVTEDVSRSWLIEKVLPAIRAKWPQGHEGPIYIQQDIARPHISVNDNEFLEASHRDGTRVMKIRGRNNYQTPHIDKGKLAREGNLPLQIECDQSLIDDVTSYSHQ
ncbi:hypothetical protein Tco_1098856 [Tanacetum coccineum]